MIAPDLSPDAPDALRERVISALIQEQRKHLLFQPEMLADAALAVLRDDTTTALARVEPEPCTATHTVQDFWQGLVGDVTYHCVRLGPHEVHSDSHEREW